MNDDQRDGHRGDGKPGDGSQDRFCEDLFWSELCEELGRADDASAQELADAERLLAGLDEGDVAPLNPALIAQLQRSAIAAAPSAEPEVHEPPPRTAPVVAGRFRRFFAAAAALLVAPQFLAAAAVVTVAVTTSYYLRNTTQTLPFIEAVQILVNEHADDASREPAQGRVAMDLGESFSALRALDGEDPELRRHADAVRGGLLEQFGKEPRFVMRRFDATLDELIDPMLDRSLPLEQRHEALEGLEAQLRFGLAALLSVRPQLPPGLLEANLVYSTRLQRLLE